MNGQINDRVFAYSHFDNDEWDSRLPVTGNSGYMDMIKREKHFVRNVVITTVIVIVLLFTAVCIFILSGVDVSHGAQQGISVDTGNKSFYFAEGNDEFIYGSLTPVDISLEKDSLDSFVSFLDRYDTDYDYSSFYKTDDAYNRLCSMEPLQVNEHSHDLRVDGVLSAQVLFNRIKQNNIAYVDDMFFMQYSDDELKMICNDLTEVFGLICHIYPEADIDMLCCSLYDYKILKIAGVTQYGIVTNDNVLFINLDLIGTESSDGENVLYLSTLYHEAVHVFQKYCSDCEDGNNYSVGVSHNFKDLPINSLSCMWLAEASAESVMCRLAELTPAAYGENIEYAELINFAVSLSDGYERDAVQRLNFLHEQKGLYELLGMDNEKQVKEIINMMYSLEIMLSDSDDFDELYSMTYGVDPAVSDEVRQNINISFNSDIMMTLTKVFYKNLAARVNGGNVALQDVFYLVRLFEAGIQHIIQNDTSELMAAYSELFRGYTEIQTEFFRLLAVDNSISSAELKAGFEDYSMNITDGETSKSPNRFLSFMSQENIRWYAQFSDRVYRTGYYSIEECASIAEEYK